MPSSGSSARIARAKSDCGCVWAPSTAMAFFSAVSIFLARGPRGVVALDALGQGREALLRVGDDADVRLVVAPHLLFVDVDLDDRLIARQPRRRRVLHDALHEARTDNQHRVGVRGERRAVARALWARWWRSESAPLPLLVMITGASSSLRQALQLRPGAAGDNAAAGEDDGPLRLAQRLRGLLDQVRVGSGPLVEARLEAA